MANIMSQIKLRNKPSRNGFDLSKKNAFTAKVGELLPVYCKEVLPGDKFNITTKWLSRTQPVNTAAFTRIREYYDFFFVPTTLLWNRFGTFVTNQLNDSQRATRINGADGMQDKQPYMTVSQITEYLKKVHVNANMFDFSRGPLSCKLLHYLGYGDWMNVWGTDGLAPRDNAELNPFPLLAYQKIYQDYFRNQQWEVAAPYTYNVDYISGAVGTSCQLPIGDLTTAGTNMFDLRYCNWNKDYFTGLLPKSQYGEAASININSLVNGGGDFNWTLRVANPTTSFTPIGANSSATGSLVYENNTPIQLRLDSSQQVQMLANLGLVSGKKISEFSVLSLRQAEAKQKWAEITQSQRQDYKSQVNAHFGVNMSDAYSDFCTYIGGVNGNLDISEVVNQNLVGDADSNIAGKGVGVGQGGIEFTAQTHGYIMCIYHAMPLLDYSMTGIKRQNLKTTFMDYAVPEFDATGMIQVPTIELTNSKITNLAANTMLGYAPRYIDYKTDIDEIHGAFFNGGLQSWVAPMDDIYIKGFILASGASAFTGLNYQFLKVCPSILNPIFGVDADSYNTTDQLLCNAYFDVKAVRNLDVNGLPY